MAIYLLLFWIWYSCVVTYWKQIRDYHSSLQQDTWVVLTMWLLGALWTCSCLGNVWRQQLTHTCQTHSNLGLNILSLQINPWFPSGWPERKKKQYLETGSHLLGPGSSVRECCGHVWPCKILVLKTRKKVATSTMTFFFKVGTLLSPPSANSQWKHSPRAAENPW